MLAYIDSSLILDDAFEDRPVLSELFPRVDVATSQITSVEIARTLSRETPDRELTNVPTELLRGIDLVHVSSDVLEIAAALPVRFLRALDAIHVASALLVEADIVLTRDRQMQRACEELGLAVA
jgi:predicted nucleic acid-binding protein